MATVKLTVMPAQRLTDKEVSTYLVYRIKTNELIHLYKLVNQLQPNQLQETLIKQSTRDGL
ncbi:MAG: hypothetical protein WCA27_31655 [Candidatus Sulfotelmatobacter sp.]